MVSFRKFRNTDPPALVRIWNEAFTNRGAVPLPGCPALERCVFAKLYFDPAGLIVAEDQGEVIGFGHAGFCCRPDETGIATDCGVICTLAVKPARRHQGVASELLRRCETYLRDHGARRVLAGPHPGCNPFYLGLYGGSDLPGFLASDRAAEPFFLRHGYRPVQTILVFQRRLAQVARLFDPRFVAFKQRFDLVMDSPGCFGSWWRNCVLGELEPIEFQLREPGQTVPAAQALLWELEGFSVRWSASAVGLLDLEVRPELRGLGVGKYFLMQILRHLNEQCYQLVETHAPETNQAAVRLFRGTGFEVVDVGKVYQRD